MTARPRRARGTARVVARKAPRARLAPDPALGYEEKHVELLRAAAALFARSGFHHASVRDLARETGRSLSGLYYYFTTKEELLFQIQHHCYSTLLAAVRPKLEGAAAPREKLRVFIEHHVGYFRHNMDEMKVLAHEDLTLTGEYGERLLDLKRDYSRILVDIVASLDGSGPSAERPSPELAAFVLFGAMNWLYTWPRRTRELPGEEIAAAVTRIFLDGFPNSRGAEAGLPEARADNPEFWKQGVPRSTGTYGKEGS